MNKVQPLRSIRNRYPIDSVALFTEGGLLAAAGIKTVGRTSTDACATVWQVNSGEPVLSLQQPGYAVRVGFSPDGKWLALVRNGLELFDSRSGQALVRIGRENVGLCEWVFSSNGKFLAIGFENGQIHLLKTKDFSLGPSLKSKSKEFQLAFSPDSRSLAITTQSQGRGVVTFYSVDDLHEIDIRKSPLRGRPLRTFFGSVTSLIMVAYKESLKGQACLWEDGRMEPKILRLDFQDGVWVYSFLAGQPNRFRCRGFEDDQTREKTPFSQSDRLTLSTRRERRSSIVPGPSRRARRNRLRAATEPLGDSEHNAGQAVEPLDAPGGRLKRSVQPPTVLWAEFKSVHRMSGSVSV
jgi:hypothetical protein